MKLDNKLYVNVLIDFYEELLTERQQEILDLYYRKDYSMNEISDELSISKAAVSDIIKRTVSQLENYENKLKNVHNHSQRIKLYDKLEMLENDYINSIVKKLKESE